MDRCARDDHVLRTAHGVRWHGHPELGRRPAVRRRRGDQGGGELVPFYASWLAAPGVDVPIVFDPKNPGKASVNWPAAANEAADRAGALDDPPPAGSIAAAIEQERGAPP